VRLIVLLYSSRSRYTCTGEIQYHANLTRIISLFAEGASARKADARAIITDTVDLGRLHRGLNVTPTVVLLKFTAASITGMLPRAVQELQHKLLRQYCSLLQRLTRAVDAAQQELSQARGRRRGLKRGRD
jgi:hypothetical protein